MLNDWVQPLRLAIDQEFPSRPCPVALATTAPDGTPAVRMMICRRVNDDGSVFFATDQRSEKTIHIHKTETVEILFWFPSRSEQYRVKGAMRILDVAANDPIRITMWRELSDATRATFFWPTPAAPREPDERFMDAVSSDVPPPENCQILQLHPSKVERLSLNPFPHDRVRWTEANNWCQEPLNP
jgi:pyridoxamine 5'-phosphate oxidase